MSALILPSSNTLLAQAMYYESQICDFISAIDNDSDCQFIKYIRTLDQLTLMVHKLAKRQINELTLAVDNMQNGLLKEAQIKLLDKSISNLIGRISQFSEMILKKNTSEISTEREKINEDFDDYRREIDMLIKESTVQARGELLHAREDLLKLKKLIDSPDTGSKEYKYSKIFLSPSAYTCSTSSSSYSSSHSSLSSCSSSSCSASSSSSSSSSSSCSSSNSSLSSSSSAPGRNYYCTLSLVDDPRFRMIATRAIAPEGLQVAPSSFILDKTKKLMRLIVYIDTKDALEALIRLQSFQEKFFFEWSHEKMTICDRVYLHRTKSSFNASNLRRSILRTCEELAIAGFAEAVKDQKLKAAQKMYKRLFIGLEIWNPYRDALLDLSIDGIKGSKGEARKHKIDLSFTALRNVLLCKHRDTWKYEIHGNVY